MEVPEEDREEESDENYAINDDDEQYEQLDGADPNQL